jgi:hypothetical protein
MPMPSSTTANAVLRSWPTAATVTSAPSLSWLRCRSQEDEHRFRQAHVLRILPAKKGQRMWRRFISFRRKASDSRSACSLLLAFRSHSTVETYEKAMVRWA